MADQPRRSGCRAVIRQGITISLWGILGLFIVTNFFTLWFTVRTDTLYPSDSFLTVDGVRIHYHEAGSGRPVLVIHGGGGTLYDFMLSPLYDLLTADYRVIFVDRPCLGYSQCPDDAPTITIQADLMHGLVEGLALDSPIIIGQSWGAGVALAVAVAYPDDVAGIVMLGGHPYAREIPREFSTFDQVIDGLVQTPLVGGLMTRTLYTPIGAAIIGPAILEDASLVAPLEERPEPWRDASLRLSLRPSHVQAKTWERYHLDATLREVMPDYGTVSVPIVFVEGQLDSGAHEQYERLLEDVPDAQLMQLEDADHYLWFAYPQAVVDAVVAVQNIANE